MKSIYFILFVTSIVSAFSFSAHPHSVFSTYHDVDTVDRFYNRLIQEHVDTILLYTEFHEDNNTTGLIAWRKQDSLHCIKFKTVSSYILQWKGINQLIPQLKEIITLYFDSKKYLADTIPSLRFTSSHEYKISLRSYFNGQERVHNFKMSQITWKDPASILAKIGDLCAEIVYDQE